MSEITCNHCGRTFDEDNNYCPSCRTPTPAQQERDFAALKKKIIFYIVGLAIFCAIMILWLPRTL
jgi:ribosomal protein L37E